MNVKLITKALHTLSLLSEEDVATVMNLRALSEDERELLITVLEPQKATTKRAGKKSGKSSAKSSRASGMAAAINRSLSQGRQAAIQDPACSFRYKDDTYCTLPESSPIHDPEGGYAGYHEFQPVALPVAHEAGAGG